MKIGYLGAGSWGFCLSSLLAGKGHQVVTWSLREDWVRQLELTREHESLPGHRSTGDMTFTTELAEALEGADVIIESVTSSGVRSVFEQVKEILQPNCPLIITSKGIEQGSGLILPEVLLEVLGEEARSFIGALSGPSFAHDVIRGLPTSVVGSAFDSKTMRFVADLFTTKNFRVYPNSDIKGVAYGGALKNVIAIACGIAEGLALGYSCHAALMTRGLHEIRKIAVAAGCHAETLYGLSGMGDLCLTCGSLNFRFGHLLAEGLLVEEAKEKIGMVVEGVYACVAAVELSKRYGVSMPISEAVWNIIYGKMQIEDVIGELMKRTIKEEHL
jgi:glycerol-3-phosphate dehydrogenase (NAD(P)+)